MPQPAQHHPDDGLVPGGAERWGERVGSGVSSDPRGAAMKALLDDLVDFNRTMLGLGINVALADIDLAAIFA